MLGAYNELHDVRVPLDAHLVSELSERKPAHHVPNPADTPSSVGILWERTMWRRVKSVELPC